MLQDVAVACGMLSALQAAAKPRQGLPLLAQADRTALQELEASKQRRRKNVALSRTRRFYRPLGVGELLGENVAFCFGSLASRLFIDTVLAEIRLVLV